LDAQSSGKRDFPTYSREKTSPATLADESAPEALDGKQHMLFNGSSGLYPFVLN
jgi:hypothetical protein